MRELSPKSLSDIKAILLRDGLVVSDLELQQFFAKYRVYEVGDFVMIYDGMGECSHGTIVRRNKKTYTIKIYGYGVEDEYTRSVVDIIELSSKEDADQYYRIRAGTYDEGHS